MGARRPYRLPVSRQGDLLLGGKGTRDLVPFLFLGRANEKADRTPLGRMDV